jgi:hypothetical protein
VKTRSSAPSRTSRPYAFNHPAFARFRARSPAFARFGEVECAVSEHPQTLTGSRRSRQADSTRRHRRGRLGTGVNASLKLAENQRFEIVRFLALSGRILWFDPRREYSSIPTANSRSRRAQGLSRLAASSRPPAGLGLDWPEHGGILDRIGAGGAHHIVGKFKPLVLGEIHAAGDNRCRIPVRCG